MSRGRSSSPTLMTLSLLRPLAFGIEDGAEDGEPELKLPYFWKLSPDDPPALPAPWTLDFRLGIAIALLDVAGGCEEDMVDPTDAFQRSDIQKQQAQELRQFEVREEIVRGKEEKQVDHGRVTALSPMS
ncbi:hypothetical protein HBH98_150830 [Parastagonospora nodorum]|nr:hypothetical protein HBH54_014280 [Parastagonospora nodorum]KAH3990210.1 hypothetical protein HBH52_003170 [Parastagonospora nodorum]KAH4006469.1 hypothetical protein HBI10_014150 [Parastagonospora nodorum]KAH4025645.1 hypothetical protein HBI13_068070 [Parastagonospora nodorum]KAH4034731.1 hypothetical protein HBI09_102570 [Parastagonospora nodorum]